MPLSRIATSTGASAFFASSSHGSSSASVIETVIARAHPRSMPSARDESLDGLEQPGDGAQRLAALGGQPRQPFDDLPFDRDPARRSRPVLVPERGERGEPPRLIEQRRHDGGVLAIDRRLLAAEPAAGAKADSR